MTLTLIDMILKVLKAKPGIKFTAREIAIELNKTFKQELKEKRNNPRFNNDQDFISQLQAEVGSHKKYIKKQKNIFIEEQNRPKLYFFKENFDIKNEEEIIPKNESKIKEILEKDLYPLLGEYLNSNEDIFSKRISEAKSKNNRGPSGNKWLHPDVVGIKILDNEWKQIVKDCVKGAGNNKISIYSFEVKKVLTSSNLRESFFQAVSNSTWANCGFLVAAEIKGDIFSELKMLSALHGIGFILLNIEDPSESQILLQSQERKQVDWAIANRLVEENKDFYNFIQSIKIYYESGVLRESEWYR